MKKMGVILVVSFVFVVLAIVFIQRLVSPDHESSESATSVEAEYSRSLPQTLSDKWQASGVSLNDDSLGSKGKSSLPFTKASVYAALQGIKVDENGELILDHDAFLALDEALERIHTKLDAHSLSQLQDLIRQALPGISGEQTAELVANYYRFLGAKEEFSQLLEPTVDYETDSTEGIEDNQRLYKELQALRELHLGNDVASELFRVSDAAANYMFDSMKLGLNTQIDDLAKAKQYQELQDKQIRDALNIDNWDQRYASFNASKRDIINASISNDQKQTQVSQLLQQHFSAREIQKMQYFSLDGI